MSLESDIKQKALELEFDAVGITTAAPTDHRQVDFYRRWLEDGCAAKMVYLHRNLDKRFAAAKLLDGAKSVICVALNYRPAKTELVETPNIRIAHFAQYEDYHPFIKDQLFRLAEFIQNQTKDTIKFKACVDSAPLAERALAQRAGLGFIGRNHMLIHPQLGNQILLGELITTLQLQPDEPLENQSCGDCGKCIRACPTGALAADGSFDARKCISYLTIEEPDGSFVIPASEQCHPGHRSGAGPSAIPSGCRVKPGMTKKEDTRTDFPNYIFGCDECILACPHERNAPPRKNSDFQHRPEWQALTAWQIHNMTEADFQKTFAHSGFLRLGLERLKRNCRV